MNRAPIALSIPVLHRIISDTRFDGPAPAHRPELGPCWLYEGSKTARGYGKTRDAVGRQVYAHRALLMAFGETIPLDHDTDHLCRVHNCIRPEHLEVVTHAENIRRGESWQARKTECPQGHPYDSVNTFLDSEGARRCRTCRRERRVAA